MVARLEDPEHVPARVAEVEAPTARIVERPLDHLAAGLPSGGERSLERLRKDEHERAALAVVRTANLPVTIGVWMRVVAVVVDQRPKTSL